jgi:hypothetical protein
MLTSSASPKKIRSVYKRLKKVSIAKAETGWNLEDLELRAPQMEVDEVDDEEAQPMPL